MNADTQAALATDASGASATPVAEGERITAMDSARGFALLGILMVNMAYFSEPLGVVLGAAPKEGGTGLDRFAAWFVSSICEGKFFTLFSTLFGMGLTIQYLRAQARGEALGWRGVRRLVFLGAIGLCHALLLWYGDILFLYAMCGLVMLLVLKWQARSLAILGVVLLGIATMSAGCLGALGGFGAQQEQRAALAASEATGEQAIGETVPGADAPAADAAAGADIATDASAPSAAVATSGEPGEIVPDAPKPWEDRSKSPIERFVAAAEAGMINDPTKTPIWQELETEAYREGPWTSAMAFRAMSWAMLLGVTILAGFGGMILGMFAIGAALLKWGVFDAGKEAIATRMAMVGLGVGWPGGILAVWLLGHVASVPMMAMGSALQLLSGAAAALGVLGLFALAARKGIASGVLLALGNAGRMAMTNYLTHTLVCTFVFYWWGLGKFGTFSDGEKFVLALGIWVVQLPLSALWLRYFRFGPMEWAWRSVTYLRAQPMRR